MKFLFGDIVIIEGNLVGVIVKSWISMQRGNNYDVYVRNYNSVINYNEEVIERYKVRHKELVGDELYYQNQ